MSPSTPVQCARVAGASGRPGREIFRGRHPVRDASGLDLSLCADDPLFHGRLLHQEGTGDLGHGQAGDHAQRKGHAGLHRECRVVAGEDQPESLVVDDVGRLGRVVVGQQLSRLVLVVALVLAPDPVDGPAVGGGGQPAELGGTPSAGHRPTAAANASAAASSAMSRSPKRLVRDATTRAHSSWCSRLIASRTPTPVTRTAAPRPSGCRPSSPRRRV